MRHIELSVTTLVFCVPKEVHVSSRQHMTWTRATAAPQCSTTDLPRIEICEAHGAVQHTCSPTLQPAPNCECTLIRTNLLSPVHNATADATFSIHVDEETHLLGPVHDATAVLARALQGEHASRPALLFAVGGHPQMLGSKDAPTAMAAGGVGIHGWGGSWHQLVSHGSPCTHTLEV